MSARNVFFIAAALVMGALSTEIADDWSARSRVAEAWFYALVPAVLDLVSSAPTWAVATVVYGLQYLVLALLVDAAWKAISPCRLARQGF